MSILYKWIVSVVGFYSSEICDGEGELSDMMVVNSSVEGTKLPCFSTSLHGFNSNITSSSYTRHSSRLKQILVHVLNQPYFSSGSPVAVHPRSVRFLIVSLISFQRSIPQPLWHLTVLMSSDTLSDLRVL